MNCLIHTLSGLAASTGPTSDHYCAASRLLVPYMTPLAFDRGLLWWSAAVQCAEQLKVPRDAKTFVTLLPRKNRQSNVWCLPTLPIANHWCIQFYHIEKTNQNKKTLWVNWWAIECVSPGIPCTDNKWMKLHSPCIPYWTLGGTPSLSLCCGNQE